jgi:hypothetical protein
MAEQDWGQRLLPGAGSESAGHRMPSRVVDGIAAETVRRRLWCVIASSLPAGTLEELAGLLRGHGRDVVLLTEVPARPGEYGSVAQACSGAGVTAADVVVVCTDPVRDTSAFPTQGARLLAIGPDRPARGSLAVPDLAALGDLFTRRTRYQSASTYHEV